LTVRPLIDHAVRCSLFAALLCGVSSGCASRRISTPHFTAPDISISRRDAENIENDSEHPSSSATSASLREDSEPAGKKKPGRLDDLAYRDGAASLTLDKPDEAEDEFLAVLLAGHYEAKQPSEEIVPPVNGPSPGSARNGQRFQIPSELPGSEAPPFRVPPLDIKQPYEERREQIEQLYGGVPELPELAEDDPNQPVWTLQDLENVAWENHPAVAAAAAQVEVTRGHMIQAGLHPNPIVGWEEDTIGSGIQGYKGPFWTQTIVTGGKLKLSRSAAAMDHENARIAYQKTKVEIATQVRQADEIYRAQIELVAGGQAAAYEPLQMRVFAVQARNAVIAAHYQVVAAGRQLGAAIGMPDAETFRIGSEAESVPPGIEFHAARTFLLENHTELRTLRNLVVQSQFRSRLEYIKPRIPDVTYYQTVQHVYEVGPFVNSTNFQISAPLPIFDRNQGNILAQESSIISHERSYGAQQNDLIRQLAMILARFETARAQARNYRQQMLPDQARTYRGVYSRYREAGPGANDDVNFGDVIVAQQMLVTAIVGYADVLQEMWQSYVAAAEILQIEDLSLLAACFGTEE